MATTLGIATDQQGTAPPAGSYRVKLKAMETDIESDFNPDGQVKWIFSVEDVIHSNDDDAEDFIGEEIHGYSNQSSSGYGSKAKTRIWYEALLGRRLEDNEPMSIEAVVGNQAVVNVVDHERKDGTATTKIAQEGGVSPYKAKKKKAAAPPPDDDDEETEDVPF